MAPADLVEEFEFEGIPGAPVQPISRGDVLSPVNRLADVPSVDCAEAQARHRSDATDAVALHHKRSCTLCRGANPAN